MKIKIFNYTIKITKNRGKYNKKWKPPSKLDSPEAPEGLQYRWIRAEIMKGRWGIKSGLRNGWSLVKAKRGDRNKYPVITEGKFKGCIGVGGLILASVPQEIVDEIKKYRRELN